MKSIAFFGLFFIINTVFGQPPLAYSISKLNEKKLQITIIFDAEISGKSFLNYENIQFGQPNQMDFIDFPEQLAGVSVKKDRDSNRFVVNYPPEFKRISVKYTVEDRQKEQPFLEYCCYKPIINSTYFHVQSCHLLAVPDAYFVDNLEKKNIQIRWENFPENWTIHNSFGPDRFQNVLLNATNLSQAIFIGGDFRRYSYDIHGKTAYFLTRGTWQKFSDDDLKNMLGKIFEGHRTFWNDFSDTLYSVTFLPIDSVKWGEKGGSLSYGGSGLTNSFLSFATNHAGLELDAMRYIFMHELMHHWIGGAIENKEEEKQYWFSEGFTEYFTLKNSLCYDFIGVDRFLEQFNDDFVFPHYSSKMNLMPNDSMNYRNFWSGNKLWEKLPYQRGCLYAFFLDNQIRKRSNETQNLDILMREILADCLKNPSLKLSNGYFSKKIRPFVGRKGVRDFKKYILRGQLIDFSKTDLPEGLALEIKDVKMSFGPSKDIITKTEIYKNMPRFVKKYDFFDGNIKKALLK
jgi:predicted metalloprotease with PDZ domain